MKEKEISWIEALNIAIDVVINYFAGSNATKISMKSETVRRLLKLLKLLGFRATIRKLADTATYAITVTFEKPRKGLEYAIKYHPIDDVRIWLKLLKMLLNKEKGVIPSADAAVLWQWSGKLLILEELGMIRVKAKLTRCFDEDEECEHVYTIYVNP